MRSNVGYSKRSLSLALFFAALMLVPSISARADSLSPAVQEKVEKYKKQLIEWAQHPKVISAAKAANLKGGLPGMTNLKWVEINETDPAVAVIFTNDVSLLFKGWVAQNASISKLYLRDKEGNLIATSNKPVFYNNAHRPPFKIPIKGSAWSDSEVNLDTTTQVNGVHLGVPVVDHGTVVGVLHTSVVAD